MLKRAALFFFNSNILVNLSYFPNDFSLKSGMKHYDSWEGSSQLGGFLFFSFSSGALHRVAKIPLYSLVLNKFLILLLPSLKCWNHIRQLDVKTSSYKLVRIYWDYTRITIFLLSLSSIQNLAYTPFSPSNSWPIFNCYCIHMCIYIYS